MLWATLFYKNSPFKMQHGWPVFSSIAVERIALNELYDRWLLTCCTPPCFRFYFMDLVKLWDWNSRLFQQNTWRSSANLLCSSLLSSINEKIINLFSFDGKGSGYFFYSHERSVWHNLGKHWHSNKYSSDPDSYISFTGCHCQFTESIFFYILLIISMML